MIRDSHEPYPTTFYDARILEIISASLGTEHAHTTNSIQWITLFIDSREKIDPRAMIDKKKRLRTHGELDQKREKALYD